MALEVDQIGLGAVPTPLESARGSQYGDSSNVINVDGAPGTKKRKRGRAGGKKHNKRHKSEPSDNAWYQRRAADVKHGRAYSSDEDGDGPFGEQTGLDEEDIGEELACVPNAPAAMTAEELGLRSLLLLLSRLLGLFWP